MNYPIVVHIDFFHKLYSYMNKFMSYKVIFFEVVKNNTREIIATL